MSDLPKRYRDGTYGVSIVTESSVESVAQVSAQMWDLVIFDENHVGPEVLLNVPHKDWDSKNLDQIMATLDALKRNPSFVHKPGELPQIESAFQEVQKVQSLKIEEPKSIDEILNQLKNDLVAFGIYS